MPAHRDDRAERMDYLDGWYVEEINGYQVILDKDGEPVDLILTQAQITEAIIQKWKAEERRKRGILRSKTLRIVVMVLVTLLIYAAFGAVIGLIQDGWGLLVAVIGLVALAVIGVKGWWQP